MEVGRTIMVLVSAVILGAALAGGGCSAEKEPGARGPQESGRAESQPSAEVETSFAERAGARQGLPRVVDLGRGKCIPCKKMAPILEELKDEYAGRASIEIIDISENRQAAIDYGIRVIPTQIFFDADGVEVWRHEGFLAKAAIAEKLSEMGVAPVDN